MRADRGVAATALGPIGSTRARCAAISRRPVPPSVLRRSPRDDGTEKAGKSIFTRRGSNNREIINHTTITMSDDEAHEIAANGQDDGWEDWDEKVAETPVPSLFTDVTYPSVEAA